MSDMPYLKPCPFCGGKAAIVEGRYEGEETYGIQCIGCGATLGIQEYEDSGSWLPSRVSVGKLSVEWNTRK